MKNSFNAWANCSENLITDGSPLWSKIWSGIVFTKEQNTVAFFALYFCNIHHEHIHTNITHYGCLMSMDLNRRSLIAIVTPYTVGMA